MALPTTLHSKLTSLDGSKKQSQPLQVEKHATQDDRDTRVDADLLQSVSSPTEADHEPEGDSGSDDDESMLGDILESAESQPYVNDGSMDIDDREISALLAFLRDRGPDAFFTETIDVRQYPPRVLGIAFGIDPTLNIDDDLYLRLLGHAVVRFFHKRKKLQEYNTLDDAARLIKERKNIMVITGAGISTSLGIPDFRSKGTGFYDKVAALGYNEPQDVFDIVEFDNDPSLFYKLAGDILPDHKLGVTPTHAFLKLLQDRGHLLRNYTQNIDDLEGLAGLSRDKIIQCHGSFATATCRNCKNKVDGKEIFSEIRAQRIARCKMCVEELKARPAPQPKRRKASSFESDDEDEDDSMPEPGVMKPDITFFGEQLPDTFFDRFTKEDAKQTDLVIVIGTSLKVAPVSDMADYLNHSIPHIYISMEPIKHISFDIQLLGKCDDVVAELCRRAGWDLKHEKVSKTPPEVAQFEGSAHIWTVQAKDERPREEPKLTASTSGSATPAQSGVERGEKASKKRPASVSMVSERPRKIGDGFDFSGD
ncbi:hypothetical protein CERZMDRAFT_66063 [Cercospora zeae-maydis SCOH1-5]|uniref:Deacetylase sirtuin-type domain-containing protein n=1 Tax=Cercospora zeae-maydis SCOH1-5 TaxID=717836 RepID=A0A6A6FN21_9PEZI|nr:hypothetical protein CERZMDRAFT_66063 [Cercospora zeae-maydis SCOH1-5]